MTQIIDFIIIKDDQDVIGKPGRGRNSPGSNTFSKRI
jgi:hypothetical protein